MRTFRSYFRRHVAALALVGIVAASLVGGAVRPASAGQNRWTALGLYGGYGFALATDPRPDGPVYVGTLIGIYRSRDDGTTWQLTADGIGTPTVLALAIDPTHADTVYAGTSGNGVWRSTDAGDHWTPTAALADGVVRAITVDATTGTVLIVTGTTGMFRSTDAGATWIESNDGLSTRALTTVTAVAGRATVYAGSNEGLFRSDDHGEHWIPLPAPPTTAITAFAVDDANPDTLFAGTHGTGVFRSTDAGLTWNGVLGAQDALALAVRPGSPSEVYVATGIGLFLSLDGGTKFTFADTVHAPLFSLAVRLAANGRVFVGTLAEGVYRSAPGDASQLALANTGLLNVYAGTFRFDAAAGSLLAGTSEGVRRSDDRGLTWRATARWAGDPAVFALLTDLVDPARFYVGVQQDGVFVTGDHGATWAAANTGLVPQEILALESEPSTSTAAYAGASFRGVFRTLDGGVSWARSGLQGATIFDLAAIRSGFIGLFAATSSGLWFSTDYAGSWTQLPGLPDGPVLNVVLGGQHIPTVLVITPSGLYRSPDAGFTWQRVPLDTAVLSVVIDRTDASLVYAGTVDGVFRSRDAGVTFERREASPTFYATALLPTGADSLLAGTADGVFRSDDGAATWTRVASADGTVSRLISDDQPSPRIFALADAGGLLRSDDGGMNFQRTPGDARVVSAVALGGSSETLLLGTRGRGIIGTTDHGETFVDRSVGLTHFVQALEASAAKPNELWAGTLVGGVFRSLDRGGHWESRGLAGRSVASLLLHPGGQDVLLAGTDVGVFLSRDKGRHWAQSGIDTSFVLSVATTPTTPTRVYVGGPEGAMFSSDDGGVLFDDASAGIDRNDAFAFAADPFDPETVFAATRAGVYRSRAQGAWQAMLGTAGRFTQSLATDASRRGSVYAGTTSNGLLWSDDGGEAWYPVTLPRALEPHLEQQPPECQAEPRPRRCRTPPRTVFGVATAPDGRLYVGTENGLYRSRDGLRWKPASGVLKHALVSVVLTAPGSNRIAYAVAGGTVFRSGDGGRSWLPMMTGLGDAQINVLHHTPRPGRLLAASSDGRLFRTEDGGRLWTSFAANTGGAVVRGFASNPRTPDELYLATIDGLYVSSDDGGSWRSRRSRIGTVNVLGLIPDPEIPGGVYAATVLGVFHSADGGVEWQKRNQGLTNKLVFALAASPQRPGRLFAATSSGGVFRSDDGGRNWRPMNEGLAFRIAIHIAIDPSDPDTVLVGCEGGGIHSYTVTP